MSAFAPSRLGSLLTGSGLLMGLLWLGLAAFTVGLVVLIWTRWGHYRPLRKCLVLSLLAHVLLAGYAATVRMVTAMPETHSPVLRISAVEGPAGLDDGNDPEASSKPVPVPANVLRDVPPTKPAKPAAPPKVAQAAPKPAAPKPSCTAKPLRPKELAAAKLLDTEIASTSRPPDGTRDNRPPDKAPAQVAAIPVSATKPSSDPKPTASETSPDASDAGDPLAHLGRSGRRLHVFPTCIASAWRPSTKAGAGRRRQPGNRSGGQGGLVWLSASQAADGHWDAARHEAGRESLADGRDHRQAGIDADSAMTGLSLLAMLARATRISKANIASTCGSVSIPVAHPGR